jgi:Terminase large subunit, T4likevirus-type, N-terminal
MSLDDNTNLEPIDEAQYYRGDKNVPKENAQFAFTPKMVKEIKKCSENIVHFAEEHFYIVNLDRGKEKIQLYKAQKKALKSLAENRFVSILASRQCGKTTITTVYALWNTCFFSDQRVIIVANKEGTAINIFKRIRMAYEMLPNYLKPGVKEYGKTGLTFDNGSSIGISTTTSTAARGDSASILCIDEAAFIEPHFMEDFWKSVIPIVSSGKKTKIFMVSTPNGTGNKFYEVYSGAEKGTNGWKAERIDWWEVPGRGEKWRKQMVAALGSEEAFQQEFGNTFLDSGNSAIGATVIERFKEQKKPVIWDCDGGAYKVFDLPNPNKLYVVGVDVGEGIGRASSVAQILDVTDLQDIKQVAVYGSNTVEPYHFANKLYNMASSWGNPPLLIERNNCGAQVIDALYQNLQYEKIVSYSKLANTGAYATTRHLGVYSHNNLRFAAVANMRYWLNFLQVVSLNDIDTIKELETFIRYPNGTYRKQSDKFFDDRVMSLVWALFMLETDLCQQYFQIDEHDDQNKPQKISPSGYYDSDPELYIIRDITTKANITSFGAINTPSYTPLISDEDSYYLDDHNLDSLLGDGWTSLQ